MQYVFAMLALLVTNLGCAVSAQPLWHLGEPLAYMTAHTPADAIAKRAQLIQAVWGAPTPHLPVIVNTFPGTGYGGELAPTYFGRTPATSIWLAFTMENNVWARTYYATFPGSTCLIIVNGGHEEGFFNTLGLPKYSIPGVDALVRSLAGKPCDIILNSMPLQGENRFAAAYLNIPPDGPTTHDQLALLKPATGSPLKYFLGPALASLNYALSQRSYDKIGALGISGGGWTTSMLAAIEPRIQRSYAVAGSVPMEFRSAVSEGDWEQRSVPFSYLDVYAMSVADLGRKSFLFYNGKDPCCFQMDSVTPWAEPLTSVLASFPSEFGAYILYSASAHDIQPPVADFILNDLAQ
ncbi:hypothetical protein [Nitrobacter sp.]|uniref:hypothetical protein n=1 Tax=Nitrobacter sp. TaxID=29420 RepID=UPI0025D6C647|nr:hypothetical protein [Nitrobacter sp.]